MRFQVAEPCWLFDGKVIMAGVVELYGFRGVGSSGGRKIELCGFDALRKIDGDHLAVDREPDLAMRCGYATARIS